MLGSSLPKKSVFQVESGGSMLCFRSNRFLSLLAGVFIMTLTAIGLGGCGAKPAAPGPAQEKIKIAVIDMNQALQSHPKYADYTALQKQINLLLAKQNLVAGGPQAESSAGDQPTGSVSPLPAEPNGQNSSASTAQNQIAEKQAGIMASASRQQSELKRQANTEYDAYMAQLDEEYRQPTFELQLKLKTLQLTKEEAADLQDKLEGIRREKAAKSAAKEAELTANLTAKIQEIQSTAQEEIKRYSEAAVAQAASGPSLSDQVAQEDAAKDVTAKSEQSLFSVRDAQNLQRLQIQLAALEDLMRLDIENECGKVARAKGYDLVVTDVTLNISADDITSEVISQFKK